MHDQHIAVTVETFYCRGSQLYSVRGGSLWKPNVVCSGDNQPSVVRISDENNVSVIILQPLLNQLGYFYLRYADRRFWNIRFNTFWEHGVEFQPSYFSAGDHLMSTASLLTSFSNLVTSRNVHNYLMRLLHKRMRDKFLILTCTQSHHGFKCDIWDPSLGENASLQAIVVQCDAT